MDKFTIFLLFTAACSFSENDKSTETRTESNEIFIEPTEKDSSEQDNKLGFLLKEAELRGFLDSIYSLDLTNLTEELAFTPDSVLNSHTDLNYKLTDKDFDTLKNSVNTKRIDRASAQRIFRGLPLDSLSESILLEGKLIVNLHLQTKKDFSEFAVSIGHDDRWENIVYFFVQNKAIARIRVFHRNGLDIQYFKSKNNKTVIFFPENFGRGTGIWWNQRNFYKFTNEKLIPVLNQIHDINLQFGWSYRACYIESEIIETSPLTFKYIYQVELPFEKPVEILSDSTIVIYNFAAKLDKYIPNFTDDKLNQRKLLSYYLEESEFLFVQEYYDLLLTGLNGKDKDKRAAVLYYLSQLKEDELK